MVSVLDLTTVLEEDHFAQVLEHLRVQQVTIEQCRALIRIWALIKIHRCRLYVQCVF